MINLPVRRGVENPNAKLDDKTVRKIRALLHKGKQPMELAKKFGVSPATITRVKNGTGWRHVK